MVLFIEILDNHGMLLQSLDSFDCNFLFLLLQCNAEAMQRLKINDYRDAGCVAQSNPYPNRPGEPECICYLRTRLRGYGSNCRFNHPTFLSQVITFVRVI